LIASAAANSPWFCLVLKIFLEGLHIDQSPWEPYIRCLPPDPPNTPLRWSSEHLQLLNGTPALHATELLSSDLQSSLSAAASLMQSDTLSHEHDALLRWAYSMALSRSIKLDNGCPALVPVFDLADHHPWNGGIVRQCDNEGSLAIVHSHGLCANSRVSLDYGEVSNAKLLTSYGFCFLHNGNRESFPLHIESVNENASLQRRMLCARRGSTHEDLCTQHMDDQLLKLAQQIEAQVAHEHEVQAECDEYLSKHAGQSEGLSFLTKLRALRILGEEADRQYAHLRSLPEGFDLQRIDRHESVTCPLECSIVLKEGLRRIVATAQERIGQRAAELMSMLQPTLKRMTDAVNVCRTAHCSIDVDRNCCDWNRSSVQLLRLPDERNLSLFEENVLVSAASVKGLAQRLLEMRVGSWVEKEPLRSFFDALPPASVMLTDTGDVCEMCLSHPLASSLKARLESKVTEAQHLAWESQSSLKCALWAQSAADFLGRHAICSTGSFLQVIAPCVSLIANESVGSIVSVESDADFSQVRVQIRAVKPSEALQMPIELSHIRHPQATAEDLVISYGAFNEVALSSDLSGCIALSVDSYSGDDMGSIRQTLMDRCGLETPTYLSGGTRKSGDQLDVPRRLLAQGGLAIAEVNANRPLAEAAQKALAARAAFDVPQNSHRAARAEKLIVAIRQVASSAVMPGTTAEASAAAWVADGLKTQLQQFSEIEDMSNTALALSVQRFISLQVTEAYAWHERLRRLC